MASADGAGLSPYEAGDCWNFPLGLTPRCLELVNKLQNQLKGEITAPGGEDLLSHGGSDQGIVDQDSAGKILAAATGTAWGSYCGGSVGLESGVGCCEFGARFVGFGTVSPPKGLCA